ncbi:hypothetical protein NUKP18_33260 [Klebsiella variicola]|nr:hypothetical protein NUKP18_33260 [Klebsiella variicola]
MPTMHAVKITNGQHTPVRGLTEIMYAAYQLHVWLKTVKIVRVYLVQLSTLTSDCTSATKVLRNSFTQREKAGKLAAPGDFYGGKAVFDCNKLVESCAITT